MIEFTTEVIYPEHGPFFRFVDGYVICSSHDLERAITLFIQHIEWRHSL